jgi:hypothetical protein
MNRKKIWTLEVRQLLYRRLVEQFGPYNTWEQATLPGRGLNEDYREFCTSFAVTVGASSGQAVQLQIAYALTISPQQAAYLREVNIGTTLLNKATAYEEGFITEADLIAFARIISNPLAA